MLNCSQSLHTPGCLPAYMSLPELCLYPGWLSFLLSTSRRFGFLLSGPIIPCALLYRFMHHMALSLPHLLPLWVFLLSWNVVPLRAETVLSISEPLPPNSCSVNVRRNDAPIVFDDNDIEMFIQSMRSPQQKGSLCSKSFMVF